MSLIDLPAQKEILWYKLRSDLTTLVPHFRDNDLLLCPACCRAINYDDFSVEHIVPKQALACDPVDVRQAVSQNDRSGLTLLCRKQLVIKGNRIPGHGCNSWKGKWFDPSLRDLLSTGLQSRQINTRHQVALYCAGYLALFRKFGYQIALSNAGRVSRNQFFYPNKFIKDVPLNCQMVLTGAGRSSFIEVERGYWNEPFSVSIDGSTALIMLRNLCFRVPISRNPENPIVRTLIYIPSKHTFRPDLTTVFD